MTSGMLTSKELMAHKIHIFVDGLVWLDGEPKTAGQSSEVENKTRCVSISFSGSHFVLCNFQGCI